MADTAPTNPTQPAPSPAPAPGPGPATTVLANPFAPSADVVARMAAPKTLRSAEDLIDEMRSSAHGGQFGRRTVRCVLKPDHPLDHTTYGGVQFAKFTEIVSNGGALRYPQQGAINHLTEAQVAGIVADARDCIARYAPGGRVKNVDGTYSPRRGRGFEGRISLLGVTFIMEGDLPTYVPPRVVVNGEKKWVPLGMSDVEAANLLNVSPAAINEARREADVRSLISLEFDPAPQAELPDSLEAAIQDARDRAKEMSPIPKHGDPGPSGPTSIEGLGALRGMPTAVGGTRGFIEGGAFVPVASDESAARAQSADVNARAAEAFATTGDKANGIPPLAPSPDQGMARDAGVKVSGTGRPSRR